MKRYIFSLLLIVLCITPLNSSLPPKKKLVIAGGGYLPFEIKEKFINFAGGKNARITLIPYASKSHEEGIFSEWEIFKVTSIDILPKEDMLTSCKLLKNSTGVWIGGGDQKVLADMYLNTLIVYELQNLLDRGGVIGGTSAGASIMSTIMPYEDRNLIGFGLVDMIIDQHFDTRPNRLRRLEELVRKYNKMGVGIDEGTALIINNGDMEILGKGLVTFIQ